MTKQKSLRSMRSFKRTNSTSAGLSAQQPEKRKKSSITRDSLQRAQSFRDSDGPARGPGAAVRRSTSFHGNLVAAASDGGNNGGVRRGSRRGSARARAELVKQLSQNNVLAAVARAHSSRDVGERILAGTASQQWRKSAALRRTGSSRSVASEASTATAASAMTATEPAAAATQHAPHGMGLTEQSQLRRKKKGKKKGKGGKSKHHRSTKGDRSSRRKKRRHKGDSSHARDHEPRRMSAVPEGDDEGGRDDEGRGERRHRHHHHHGHGHRHHHGHHHHHGGGRHGHGHHHHRRHGGGHRGSNASVADEMADLLRHESFRS